MMKQSYSESELPILVYRLDSPVELLAHRLREKLLYWDVELFRENHGQAGIYVILCYEVALVIGLLLGMTKRARIGLDNEVKEEKESKKRKKREKKYRSIESEKTHKLRCAKGNFLVILLIFGLKKHILDTLVDFANLAFEFLDSRTPALGLNLFRLILSLIFGLELIGSLESFLEFFGLHLLFSIGDSLLILFVELLAYLLAKLLCEESLMFLDPLHV